MNKIKIRGMSCDHCLRAVRAAIAGVPGVFTVEVSLEAGEAVYQSGAAVDHEAVREAVRQAGYEVL